MLTVSDPELFDEVKAALSGRLRVLREVGRGAFGVVFQVQEHHGRTVALKVIRREFVTAVGRERILNELAFAARLSHPHILPIIDAGEANGIVYYCMPFLTVGTLRARLDREERLPLDQVLQIGQDVADAMSYAHAHNVLHCDINPANVFVESGRAVVKDFWIARALAAADRSTLGLGLVLGTPAYMSPEHMAAGTDIGPRSDVYSLACVVYEMLAGAPPLSGPWAAPVAAHYVGRDLPLPSARSDVSPEAMKVIVRALAKTPAERFGTPTEFIEAFQRAVTPGGMMRARRGFPRPALLVASLAILAAAVLGGGGVLVFSRGLVFIRSGEPAAEDRTWVWVIAALFTLIGIGTVAAMLLRRGRPTAFITVRVPSLDPEERIRRALNYRYEIDREVGRGGMAVVYLVRDLKYSRRTLAMKVLRPELAASVESERFLREIEIAAQLTHPAIVPLLDSGDADGLPFYVMPFIEEESLRHRILREGRLPIADAREIVRSVAGALDYAHRRGIVHRDIKPENILFFGGHASIADFGIALALDTARKRITANGLSPGTLEYMSPEQLLTPESIDHRTDLYSLGCVMFEMLAGQPPYTGTPEVLPMQHVNAPVPQVRTARPDAPEAMEAAICRLLSKNRAERFVSAAELTAVLG